MLEQLERHQTRERIPVPRLEIAPPAPVLENDQRQRRRMVVALVLLLVALSLVLMKDRDFWFPPSEVADNEAVEDSAPEAPADPASPAATAAPTPAPPIAKKHPRTPPPVHTQTAPPVAQPAGPMVTASRAVLPPMRVEVSAGDRAQAIRSGSSSVAVDLHTGMQGMASGTETAQSAVMAAGDHIQMTTDTRQAVTRPVRPEYPLLARQMKVQGAVLLNAMIGKDGGIQNLQVLSGPAILADAAREAVKQWRFKPYLVDGQPVETEAKVTVNFEIHAN